MEAKDVLKELRQRHNMTQDQLAEKLAVTRQAVSRWENGESVPNPETLKQLSALFDTSINHLLGDPRKLICQCCGMPLDSDEVISRDLDGSFNEDYCKWCYTDSKFTYDSMEQLLEFLVTHMSNEQFPPEQARTYFSQTLPQLKSHTAACLNIGIKPAEVREAVYQCAPFIGFPKTLNAIAAMNETFEKSVPTEELALSTLPKAKKMPAMTRKQPINT